MTAQLAPDIELLGPYLDSGLENPPYLVRRGDRILSISRLLHTVAAEVDGHRTLDEVAAVAGAELGRPLTGDDVRFLIDQKLAPAGILTVAGGSRPASGPPSPPQAATDTRLLALRFRRAVVSPAGMRKWGRMFGPLFHPAVVIAVLTGVIAADSWIFGAVGIGSALDDVARSPALMLFLFATVCLSGIFHEFGHAAGCSASGGRPGAAGVGLYLWWPVLYTNVTDAYRLDRRGRLRTDLGGIYCNAILILVAGAAFALTGWRPLLAVVVVEHVLILHQLTPFVRLDGFYIVSDLAGVPDILSRVRPAAASLLPGRAKHPAVVALRPRARRILYGYLVSLALFVLVIGVPSLLLLPRMVSAGADGIGAHLAALRAAAGRWDTIGVAGEALQAAVLALPLLGLVLTLGYAVIRSLGRFTRSLRVPVRRWLDDSQLAIVDGTELPGGGAVDYFGFGPSGEVVLFGAAIDEGPRDVAARLVAAAQGLQGLSADSLDRLLADGPPFVEVAAVAARRRGEQWQETEFRAKLDDRLALGDFGLFVLQPSRFGTALRVYPLARRKMSQN